MTAVLGTERQAPVPDSSPLVQPGGLLAGLDPGNAEHALLAAAGALALYERAGRLPGTVQSGSAEVAADETLPRCSARAAHHLDTMLNGQYAEVLPEWLA